eukprot:jgi/Bigna1/85128/estExt_fgenesh1_pg.C_20256
MAAGSPWKQLLRAGLTRPRSGCLRAAFSSGSEAKEIRRLKSSDIPSEAQAVVVGGGIIGCSVAYHLAEMGTDVVLLERDKADIRTPVVVNCAGMWARQLGEMSGVGIPNQVSNLIGGAAEHYYLVTDEMQDVDPDWPVIEDPSSYTYIRCVDNIPPDSSFTEISPDWERMSPFLETAMSRVPRTLEVGAKNFFCGPESFTPDLAPIVGEAPELEGYFVGAGLNSIGILTGGGIGRLLAHWVKTGIPDMDVTGMNIDRLHRYQSNPLYRAHRVVESLGMVYKCHYPFKPLETARNVKRSPLHTRLEAQGAYFKDVSGWESPDWYAGEGKTPEPGPLSFGKHDWFPQWKAEHDAVRQGVGLIDMSFMSKFMVEGRDAGAVLNALSTANVDPESDMITYTQWLNETGKMEADLTVAKLGEDKFFVVATDTMHRHVEAMIKKRIRSQNAFAICTDVSGAFAQINIQGPRARELLAKVTSVDMGNEAFPFRTAKDIDIGYSRALCVRITYVGELGYELYIPTENALHV